MFITFSMIFGAVVLTVASSLSAMQAEIVLGVDVFGDIAFEGGFFYYVGDFLGFEVLEMVAYVFHQDFSGYQYIINIQKIL